MYSCNCRISGSDAHLLLSCSLGCCACHGSATAGLHNLSKTAGVLALVVSAEPGMCVGSV